MGSDEPVDQSAVAKRSNDHEIAGVWGDLVNERRCGTGYGRDVGGEAGGSTLYAWPVERVDVKGGRVAG